MTAGSYTAQEKAPVPRTGAFFVPGPLIARRFVQRVAKGQPDRGDRYPFPLDGKPALLLASGAGYSLKAAAPAAHRLAQLNMKKF